MSIRLWAKGFGLFFFFVFTTFLLSIHLKNSFSFWICFFFLLFGFPFILIRVICVVIVFSNSNTLWEREKLCTFVLVDGIFFFLNHIFLLLFQSFAFVFIIYRWLHEKRWFCWNRQNDGKKKEKNEDFKKPIEKLSFQKPYFTC